MLRFNQPPFEFDRPRPRQLPVYRLVGLLRLTSNLVADEVNVITLETVLVPL